MKDCPNNADNSFITANWKQGGEEPLLQLIPSLFIHHQFVIFHVITDNEVWSHLQPLQTTQLLLRTLSHNTCLMAVLEYYDNVGFSIFQQIIDTKQISELVIVHQLTFYIIQE